VLAVEAEARAALAAADHFADDGHVSVVHGRVDHALVELAEQGVGFDVAVLDPPRTGAGRDVLAGIVGLGPRAVAYVACDPAALARDLAYAAELGYELAELTAYDAFPMTHHVECVAILRPAADATSS
jgi:tRNA/tmRNA/rRNA uracil-C5-methylase (TrmA/RlmC/RlmD family)